MSVTVLAGLAGGLYLRIENTAGEVSGELLTREAAEALIEQASATLRCAPLDPHAGAVASLDRWKALHACGACPDCDNTPACTCEIAEPLIGQLRQADPFWMREGRY